MDEYSTHVPVLEQALETFAPHKILEHGCGLYSSPIFSRFCKTHCTEHDNEWINTITNLCNQNYKIVSTERDILNVPDIRGYDLIFIDGAREGRVPSAQRALDSEVPVVIIHDWNVTSYYGYNHLRIPEEYVKTVFRCKDGGRETCVLSLSSAPRDWIIRDHQTISF